MRPDVAALNAAFPKYPKTVEDKGWIYGVWYCGRPFGKQQLYGQYPMTFLNRALALFPDVAKVRILHCPSGLVDFEFGMTIDRTRYNDRCPVVIGDSDDLPFDDSTYDLVLSDPPYSDEDCKKYDCPPYPLKKSIAEFHRVLRPHGYLGLLHQYIPSFNKKAWALKGAIAVVCGTNSRIRIFSLFQKMPRQEAMI